MSRACANFLFRLPVAVYRPIHGGSDYMSDLRNVRTLHDRCVVARKLFNFSPCPTSRFHSISDDSWNPYGKTEYSPLKKMTFPEYYEGL
jgi:hypothetical protein